MQKKQKKRKRKKSEFKEIVSYSKRFKSKFKNLDKELEKLEAMVGMKTLKNAVLAQVKFLMCNKKNTDDHFLHTLILGPPGCGKTTVAKILFNIWKSLGIASESFTILHRSDFVGNYMGQTSNKTRKTLKKNIGGCLFIDEFYSIVYGEKDDYGKEALDELCTFMSENKDTVVIAAGYEDKIKNNVFSAQPGLHRRFGWVFNIEPYTADDLFQIFTKQLRKHGWSLSDKKGTQELFYKYKSKFKNAGGDTENIAFKAKIAYSKRHWKSPGQRKLRLKDIQVAMESHFVDEKKTFLHSMYI